MHVPTQTDRIVARAMGRHYARQAVIAVHERRLRREVAQALVVAAVLLAFAYVLGRAS